MWSLLLSRIDQKRKKIYKDIDSIPAWKYFKIVEKNDLSYLFINRCKSRYIPVVEFEEINEQFALALNGGKRNLLDIKMSELISLRKKYFIISTSLNVLSVIKDQGIIDILNNLGYNIDMTSDETYLNSLMKVERSCKIIDSQLKQKSELVNEKIKEQNDTKVNVNYLKQIITFEEVLGNGIKIQPYSISLAQFAEYSNLVKEKSIKNGRRNVKTE